MLKLQSVEFCEYIMIGAAQVCRLPSQRLPLAKAELNQDTQTVVVTVDYVTVALVPWARCKSAVPGETNGQGKPSATPPGTRKAK